MSETSFAAPTRNMTAEKMLCAGGNTSSAAPAVTLPMISTGLRSEPTMSRRRRSRLRKLENCSFWSRIKRRSALAEAIGGDRKSLWASSAEARYSLWASSTRAANRDSISSRRSAMVPIAPEGGLSVSGADSQEDCGLGTMEMRRTNGTGKREFEAGSGTLAAGRVQQP